MNQILVTDWVKLAANLKGALSDKETERLVMAQPSGTWSREAWVAWFRENKRSYESQKKAGEEFGWWFPINKISTTKDPAGNVTDVHYNRTPGVASGARVNINAFLDTQPPVDPATAPATPATPAPAVDPFALDTTPTPAAPATTPTPAAPATTPTPAAPAAPAVPGWFGEESGIIIRGHTTYKREGKDGVYIILDNGDVLYQQYFFTDTGQLLQKGKDPDVDGNWEPITDISTLY